MQSIRMVRSAAYPTAGGGSDASISAVSNSIIDASVTTTHTHSGMSFGVADGSRILIAGISIVPNGTLGSVSSVTIGGVTATHIARVGSTQEGAEIWAAAVPTGTSGSVVVVNSTNFFSTEAVLWRMLNGQITPSDTDTDETGNPISVNLDIPAGGVAVCITAHRINDPGVPNYTVTGLTEDYDNNVGTGGSGVSASSKAFASIQTGLSITVTAASAGLRAQKGVFASFPKV